MKFTFAEAAQIEKGSSSLGSVIHSSSTVPDPFLAAYSPFLNPIEEFWAKLKDIVNKDPASVRENTKLSERIQVFGVRMSKSLAKTTKAGYDIGEMGFVNLDFLSYSLSLTQIRLADSIWPNWLTFAKVTYLQITDPFSLGLTKFYF